MPKGSRFIIKPPDNLYDEAPKKKDLTMRLPKVVNIEVPHSWNVL